jgi:hypothetical protein
MLTHPGAVHVLPPRRLPRAGPVLALAAVVLLLHGWLAALLAPGAPRAGLPQGAPVLLRSLPANVVAAAVSEAAPLPDAAPVADPPAARAPHRTAARAPARPAGPANAPAADAPVPAPTQTAPGSAVTDPLADAATATETAGEPPPLYATRHNSRAGSATLHWQHDGSSYRLTLEAQGTDGRPLLAQASTGDIDAHGVAPLRFVDRRAGGRQRAANFRREIGRIGYSGPGHEHPAWPGAQDRLSWLAQLAAILAAAEVAPDALRLFVADATGQAGLWQLQRLGDGDTRAGADTVHWRREPPRPEGLQIDLWLPAPGTGSADRAGWPRRLLFTVPRSGDQLELVLQPPP